MHGRRGTGVERRKWGHSWYQSCVCIISFSSYPLYRWMHNRKKKRIFFLFFFLFSLFAPSSYCFTFPLSTEPQMSHVEKLDGWLHFLPASFFTPRLAQQVCVRTPPPESSRWHMVPQTQMSDCVPRLLDDRQLPLARAFCCFSATLIYGSAVRATGATGWLASSLLTQSFTACIGNAGCVCECGTVPVRQPAWYFFAGSAETWPGPASWSKSMKPN